MKENIAAIGFANTLVDVDNAMPNGILSDCEKYGMTFGCKLDCPDFVQGKCKMVEEVLKQEYNNLNEGDDVKIKKTYPDLDIFGMLERLDIESCEKN